MTLSLSIKPRLAIKPCLVLLVGSVLLISLKLWAQDAERATPVQAQRLAEQPLVETVPLTGSVTAERRSRISPQLEGLVYHLAVEVGDAVQAGDLLLELDPELTGIDRDRARAELQSAEAELQDSQRRLREAQTLESGAIAASEIRALEAQVRIDEAARNAARAGYARLEAELERHRLRAPYAGTVSARLVDLGEWVAPGDNLMELVATEPLRVHFQVPQRYYPRLEEQANLTLRFDAYPEQEFRGEIHRKVPVSEQGARTFLLRVTPLMSDELSLIPGMSTSGRLRLDTERTGIAVPRDALIRYPDGRVTVWVITEPAEGEVSTVREQRVRTGMSDSGWVEIRSGLEAGQVVVTLGNEALQEGQSVLAERIADSSDSEGL